MVAALKKMIPEDLGGKFSAWWDGKDYLPPEARAEEDRERAAVDESDRSDLEQAPVDSRMLALETLWGEGRFSPGNAELYNRLTEGMSALEGGMDVKMGTLCVDPALIKHFMGVSGSCPVIADWRDPCIASFREHFSDFDVLKGYIDRPPFEPGDLQLLVTQDAFVYSDHKSGLAVRALRSLAPGGQWVVIDLVRGQAKGNLAPAFASAWCEAQLCHGDDIVEMCEAAGFELSSSEDDFTGDLVQASRSAFERFGAQFDEAFGERLNRANKTKFLQEIAWEAESWKWRQRALAGELIHAKIWRFRKPDNSVSES